MMVFLSYSTKDRLFVEQKLIPFLQSHGVTAWYSMVDIRTADDWERSIREALQSCDSFLVVLSPNSVNSEWVRAEVFWAMENRNGRVIPVLLADCNPSQLHLKLPLIEYVDLHEDCQTAWKKLAAVWNRHSNGQQSQQAKSTETTTPRRKKPQRSKKAKSSVSQSMPQAKPTGNAFLDAAWENYMNETNDRRLYRLEEAARLGHPAVKEELLRLPVSQHCLEIAASAPFAEYVPIAIHELTTTYDQSSFSACKFLGEAERQIANDIEEPHLIPAVATAANLAEIHDDNETATCFGSLVWFVGSIGHKNPEVETACRHILRRIGKLDLDDWHRKELDDALAGVGKDSDRVAFSTDDEIVWLKFRCNDGHVSWQQLWEFKGFHDWLKDRRDIEPGMSLWGVCKTHGHGVDGTIVEIKVTEKTPSANRG